MKQFILSDDEYEQIMFERKMYRELNRRISNIMTFVHDRFTGDMYKALHEISLGGKPTACDMDNYQETSMETPIIGEVSDTDTKVVAVLEGGNIRNTISNAPVKVIVLDYSDGDTEFYDTIEIDGNTAVVLYPDNEVNPDDEMFCMAQALSEEGDDEES